MFLTLLFILGTVYCPKNLLALLMFAKELVLVTILEQSTFIEKAGVRSESAHYTSNIPAGLRFESSYLLALEIPTK